MSVSILIPFLPQFYTLLPFSPSHRELLSSVYNISQIAGGALIGGMSDVGGKKVRRREERRTTGAKRQLGLQH
jgi:hypothetical protein